MGEKRLVTFNVTVELDPEAYADEYGYAHEDKGLAQLMADSSVAILQSQMLESVTLNGVTRAAFADNFGHWAKVHVSGEELLPVHRDALKPGEPNPYDAVRRQFKAVCTCGEVFWSDLDGWDADCLLMDHADKANAEV